VEDITVAAMCPKISVNGIDDYIRIVKLLNVVSNRLLSFLRMTACHQTAPILFSIPFSYRIYSSITAHAVSQF
jgi:hypothetical protein